MTALWPCITSPNSAKPTDLPQMGEYTVLCPYCYAAHLQFNDSCRKQPKDVFAS